VKMRQRGLINIQTNEK